MKRSAGIGLLVLLMLAPAAHATPLSLEVAPNATRPQAQHAGLQFDAAASAEAEADAEVGGGGPIPLIRSGPVLPDAHSSEAAPSPGDAAAAGVAATTLVGLGLLVYFWGHLKSWALGSLVMPLFSRIAGHRILDNDVRNRVHEAIAQNPGITIKQITETLGIGWGTAVYHLKRLETERLIVSERYRQFRRYFRNGGGIVNDDKAAFAELKNPTSQRLAAELLHRPGAAQKDLCLAVGISAPLAHKYLARLEAANLLTKQREWKTVRYFPTPRLGELLTPEAVAPIALVA